MTKPDGGADDGAVDALLQSHFSAVASSFETPRQPPIASLLPARRSRRRWWSPAAVAGGLIAAVTATVLVVSPGPRPPVNGIDQPPEEITVSGREYELVGAVPWYRAMRSGNTVAVTTGPEVRGACDPEIYRVEASHRGGDLVLTSYRYDPVDSSGSGDCAAVGLPTYVAAVNTDLELPDQVVDGSTPSAPSKPLTAVLFPRELPAGIIAKSETDPQPADPERPSFPAAPGFETPVSSDGPILQSYSGGRQYLDIRQGLTSLPIMGARARAVSIGQYRALLQSSSAPGTRCLQWKDHVAGNIEVCGVLSGGDAALIAVARSIYAPTTATSATPSASTGPTKQITVNGAEYSLVGAVPWYSAMRIGNTVAVSTGPKIRGACDAEIYRLAATRTPDGGLMLTSYRYNPPRESASRPCLMIALAPYVAALELSSAPPSTVLDGTRPADRASPLTEVLVPTVLPPGFSSTQKKPPHAQAADPDRPSFPAYSAFGEGIGQTFASGSDTLSVIQGLPSFTQGYSALDETMVGPYPATINASAGSPERCVRWTDTDAGLVEVCGTLTGGAKAVVAVARSIYP